MTDQQWGRREDAGRWIYTAPTWTIATLALAGLTLYGASRYHYERAWTDAQRTYLKAYLKSTVAAELELGPRAYVLPNGAGLYENGEVVTFLQDGIYEGQTLPQLAFKPLLAAGLMLVFGLVLAFPKDLARRRERRHGRRLKGPQLVDAALFNIAVRGDGIAILEHPSALRIPQEKEASHILLLGDTGTGKSTLIRQFLCQVRERQGERVVLYDPAREYITHFFDAARGDHILNPLDARCPYWTPADEVQRPAEALTVAAGLFQLSPSEKDAFFVHWAREIFAHLLMAGLSAHDLAYVLSHEPALDAHLLGTPGAAAIRQDGHGAQRNGVIAHLNLIANTLLMLPREGEGSGRWSANTWAREGTGWLFVTSVPHSRERQIPLMTLWIDLLILRLLQQQGGPKTWMIIDELASLRKIPQLEYAMTEGRKSNLAMVLGFQAKSQMEAIYGTTAAAMLSQPATKIFLRTSEAASAKWVADTIGEVETERMRQSRSEPKGSRTWALEREVKPLVLPSQIEGLTNRCGFLKHENYVAPIQFPYLCLPKHTEAFIERLAVTASVIRPLSTRLIET